MRTGAWVSSQPITAANQGASWLAASTPTAATRAKAGTATPVPSAATPYAAAAPNAAPVAMEGVSRPPVAPVRMLMAVTPGLSSRRRAKVPAEPAPIIVSWTTPLPLPGRAGNHTDRTPRARPPAVMTAGRRQVGSGWRRAAPLATRRNPRPTTAHPGMATTAQSQVHPGTPRASG